MMDENVGGGVAGCGSEGRSGRYCNRRRRGFAVSRWRARGIGLDGDRGGEWREVWGY